MSIELSENLKVRVARSQLLTAIRLHLDDDDPYSVHTLGGAAQEILETLCLKADVPCFMDHIKNTWPNEAEAYLKKIVRRYRNSFKHADRDDHEAIKAFDEGQNDYIILMAVEDYVALLKKSPVTFQVFMAWFYAVHEEALHPAFDLNIVREIFPGIRGLDRGQQKKMAIDAIEKYSDDPRLLTDPATEPPQ